MIYIKDNKTKISMNLLDIIFNLLLDIEPIFGNSTNKIRYNDTVYLVVKVLNRHYSCISMLLKQPPPGPKTISFSEVKLISELN